MPNGFSNHGEALRVSAEVDSSALEKVDMTICVGCRLRNNVLVVEEGPSSDGVFTMAAIICFLKRSRESFERGHAGLAKGRG